MAAPRHDRRARLGGAVSVAVGLAALVGGRAAAGDDGEPRRPGRSERWPHPASRMVRVPAGSFLMGFADTDRDWDEARDACERELGARYAEDMCGREALFKDASPGRRVYLSGYLIDRREVTAAEYRACVAAGRCDVGPLTSGDQRYAAPALPVVNATWQDASDFCAFRGGRLPTEAEWERAARGVDGRRWPWGDRRRDDDFNHGMSEAIAMQATHGLPRGVEPEAIADPSDGAAYLAPPGSEPWSTSPVGADDMAGNVAEWVADYYAQGGYAGLPLVDPIRRSRADGMSQRVVRGGSWRDPPYRARTYARQFVPPGSRSPTIGFRCAADLR